MPNLFLSLFSLAVLSGQPPDDRPAPLHVAPNVGRELAVDPNLEEARRFEAARGRIRRHVEIMYGADCEGGIELPDQAFMAVEITGTGAPELAVSLALSRCGEGRSAFTGTGGALVQFWRIEDGRTTLLLDQQMHGFTPSAPYLVTFQHGGYCPGGAGPQQCRIVYRWDSLANRLENEDRQLMGDEGPTFTYSILTGTEACDATQAARDRCRR